MDLPVKIYTNATQTSDTQIAALAALGTVRVNVSFDGFRPSSHGRFRGDRDCFAITRETTRRFADAGLLAAPEQTMRAITAATVPLAGRVELVPIRFPNGNRPLSGCDAGTLIYVFANGDTAVCPYLVFAARTPQSRHTDREFLVGNILHGEIADALDRYRFHDRYQVGANPTCSACAVSDSCGKGCPAAVVAAGQPIGAPDAEQCPPETVRRPLIPIQPVRA